MRFVELADAHFRTDSAVVLPEGEDPDAEGKHQSLSSVGLIAQALRFNEEQPGRSVFVAGHTDTSAGDALNDKLSAERAQCALALLEGDRDTFGTVANARHQGKDINQILSWISEAFEAPAFDCKPAALKDFVSSVTVRKFQKAFNRSKAALGSTAADLTVDGSVGELTWGAFFDCYEFALRQELGEDAAGVAGLRSKLKFVDETRKSLGFGERFPTEALGVDNFRSQTNRRVEILFFEPGQEPDLAHSEDDPETSDVYLPGNYSRESMPTRASGKVKLVSMVVTALDNFRLVNAPFAIKTNEGLTIIGTTDENGTVLAKVPLGTRTISLHVEDPDPTHELRPRYESEFELVAFAPATTPLGATQRMRALGVWDGPPISVFGEGSLEALSYFQFVMGLPRSGQLDAATADALETLTHDSGDAT